jgi:hypothetical protein
MFKMSVQMEMTVGQLDWLSRPFIKKDHPEYQVKLNIKIPDANFYSEPISYGHEPGVGFILTTEHYRLLHFENSGFEGPIEGQQLRKYLLDLKQNIEKEINEIGLDKKRFFIEVNFEVEELQDMRLY